MTRILSLDTTSQFGSVALLEDDRVLEELLLHSPEGFSHVIYDHLERLLSKAGWKVSDVDCFAAASGPGSFTGVRVGLAAVKGLAEAVGGAVVGVSNLRALGLFGSAPLRATLLDARRGEVYCALYDSDLEPVQEEAALKFPAWLASLSGHGRGREIEFLSTDFAPFRPALAGTDFADAALTTAPRAQAAAIARIAARVHAAGEAQEPAAVDANYVRRSDAELKWRDR